MVIVTGFKSHKGEKNLSLADVNQLYYDGHTMAFWPGKIPKDTKEKKAFWEWLESSFHSYNIIEECVDHYVNALVGQDFTFTVEGENKEEAEEVLKKWWKWQKKSAIDQGLPHGEAVKDVVTQMLVRDEGQGKGVGYLRLSQPEKFKFFKERKGEEFKRYILHAVCPGSISIDRDDDDFIDTITHTHGSDRYEYTLEKGICKVKKNDEEVISLDLGGRFPIFPVSGKCLITESAKQIQNSINHALTMKDVNVGGGGFRERYLLNTQSPGRWQTNRSTGQREWIEDPGAKITLGAGSVTRLTGIPLGERNSPTGYADPKIEIADPVPIDIFADSVHLDCETIYYLFALAHLLSAGDGNVSGKSRTAIQKDYISNLHGCKDNIEGALSNAMEVMLIHLDDEKFSDIEVTTTLTLSFDLIPEMITMYVMMIEAGLIAKETVIKKLGNPNAVEELEKILEEREKEVESSIEHQSFVDKYNPKEEPVAA